MLKTLFHEIVHGVITEFGLDNLIEKNNEIIVDLLSSGIVDTLIRNKIISLESK